MALNRQHHASLDVKIARVGQHPAEKLQIHGREEHAGPRASIGWANMRGTERCGGAPLCIPEQPDKAQTKATVQTECFVMSATVARGAGVVCCVTLPWGYKCSMPPGFRSRLRLHGLSREGLYRCTRKEEQNMCAHDGMNGLHRGCGSSP